VYRCLLGSRYAVRDRSSVSNLLRVLDKRTNRTTDPTRHSRAFLHEGQGQVYAERQPVRPLASTGAQGTLVPAELHSAHRSTRRERHWPRVKRPCRARSLSAIAVTTVVYKSRCQAEANKRRPPPIVCRDNHMPLLAPLKRREATNHAHACFCLQALARTIACEAAAPGCRCRNACSCMPHPHASDTVRAQANTSHARHHRRSPRLRQPGAACVSAVAWSPAAAPPAPGSNSRERRGRRARVRGLHPPRWLE